ncbi:hypothetical protein [Fibrella aestuarina]|uniref:hypothetical protein n=1 Tax=Fibrella aestuarina TaxID=651143 RepID=UPI00059E8782|nr:hypothetical protein [Fibrella aestuarina]
MPRFAFEKIEFITGREQVFQLVIDGVKQLDLFEQETGDQYARHYQGILAVLEMAVSGVRLPKEKYHPFNLKKTSLKVFECKRSDLRLYGFQGPDGKVIVLGGFKNRQPADIRRLESLLKEIEEYLNLNS